MGKPSTVLTSPSLRRRLDPSAAVRVLRRLKDQKQSIALQISSSSSRASSSENHTLSGTLIDVQDTRLRFRLAAQDAGPPARWDGTRLRVEFDIGDTHHTFDTIGIGRTPTPESMIGEARFPLAVYVDERRRSYRRQFREPTDVVLADVEAPDGATLTGQLLNLSAEGLACRIPESAFLPVGIGKSLRVQFHPRSTEQRFDLRAHVVSVTQGGTPGGIILGMEFLQEVLEPGDRDRLRELTSDTDAECGESPGSARTEQVRLVPGRGEGQFSEEDGARSLRS